MAQLASITSPMWCQSCFWVIPLVLVGNASDVPLVVQFIEAFCHRFSLRYFSPIAHERALTKYLIRGQGSGSSLYYTYQQDPDSQWDLESKTINLVLNLNQSHEEIALRKRAPYSGHQDIWLIRTEDWTSALNHISLDFDDDVFLFQVSNRSGPMIELWEAYRINNDMDPVSTRLGVWRQSRGFELTPEAKWDRRRNLQGAHFQLSSLSAFPYSKIFTLPNDEVTVGGIFGDIFFNLQRILNFTYTFTIPPDTEWGTRTDNGSWSGLVGIIVRNEVEFAPAGFTRTKARSKDLDFALPINHFHHRFFIQNPRDALSWKAYMEPLTFSVWAAILLLSLIFPPFMTFLAFMPGAQEEPQRRELTLWNAFAFSISTLTFAKGWSITPVLLRNRILFLVILLGGSVIFWHWEAMIISYLAVRTPALPFQDLEGLLDKTNKKILVLPGTAYVDGFRDSKDPLVQKAWDTRIKDYIQDYPNTRQGAVEYISNHDDAAFYDNFYSSRTFEAYTKCQIIALPKRYDPKAKAFAFRKNSPFLPLFNFHLKKMMETGSMNVVNRKHLDSPGQACADFSGQPLGYTNCFTAFLVLIAGCILGLATFLVETCSPFLNLPSIAEVKPKSIYGKLGKKQLISLLEERDRLCT